jgi:hypothetical protein
MLQKELLDLVDELNIDEVFARLDKAGIRHPLLTQLRREYVAGKAAFDYYDRLKTALRSEVDLSVGGSTPPPPPADPKKLLSQGKVGQAIELLLAQLAGPDHDTVILLSGRWHGLQREVQRGLLSHEQATLQTNQITAALLDLLGRR